MNEIEAWQKIREAFLNKRKSILEKTYSREDDKTIARNGLCLAIHQLLHSEISFETRCRMREKISRNLGFDSNGELCFYFTGKDNLYDKIAGVECRLKFLDEVISSLTNEGKEKE